MIIDHVFERIANRCHILLMNRETLAVHIEAVKREEEEEAVEDWRKEEHEHEHLA
jgi:hypothetical protein